MAEYVINEDIRIEWSHFKKDVVSSLEHLRFENRFTDITISCEGYSTNAHRIVLCACSPYFKNILDQDPNQSHIILEEVPFQDFTTILDFIYTGKITIAYYQLQNLLLTAQCLQVDSFIEATQTAVVEDEDEQQVSLFWDRSTMMASFEHLREENSCTDVYIQCGDETMAITTMAHKVVLWACSPYFRDILDRDLDQNLVIVKEVSPDYLTAILDFIYAGYVTVSVFHLRDFITAAEMLGIKGLFQAPT